MKKLLFVPLLIASLLAAIPAFAADGIAVIDMRNAVLATQVAQDAFKALEEETEYAANIERATLLQTERQAIAENSKKTLRLYRKKKSLICKEISKKKVKI
jgi:Skp family chaperone for outer membrane proteins